MRDTTASVMCDEVELLEAEVFPAGYEIAETQGMSAQPRPSPLSRLAVERSLLTHATSTTSRAISRFEYSMWLCEAFGLELRPYPLRSRARTVKPASTSLSAILW